MFNIIEKIPSFYARIPTIRGNHNVITLNYNKLKLIEYPTYSLPIGSRMNKRAYLHISFCAVN